MVKVKDIIELIDDTLEVKIFEDRGFNSDKLLIVYDPASVVGSYDGYYDNCIVIGITPSNNALSIVIEK